MNPGPESHPDKTRAETEERSLAAAEMRMMEELAASVFDEFNQPLTNIVINGGACLRFLTGDAPNLEQAREAVCEVLQDAKRACEAYYRVQTLAKKNSPPKQI